jgi:hypothetical protein
MEKIYAILALVTLILGVFDKVLILLERFINLTKRKKDGSPRQK